MSNERLYKMSIEKNYVRNCVGKKSRGNREKRFYRNPLSGTEFFVSSSCLMGSPVEKFQKLNFKYYLSDFFFSRIGIQVAPFQKFPKLSDFQLPLYQADRH